MTTEEVIRRLQHAPEYTELEVAEAVKECFDGTHGEFVMQVMQGLIKAYELGKEHGE